MELSVTVLVCHEKFGWKGTYNEPQFSAATGNILVVSSAGITWVWIFRGNFVIN